MKKVGSFFKQFLSSLWEDFVALLKTRFFRLLGFIVMYILPIVVLLTTYVKKVDNSTKYTVPFAIVLPIVILLLMYWGKLRRFISYKVGQMKTENNIQKGKHAAAIIICDIFQVLMTILPFVLCYIVIGELQKFGTQSKEIFLFLIVCESVGGFLVIVDTIKNVTNWE